MGQGVGRQVQNRASKVESGGLRLEGSESRTQGLGRRLEEGEEAAASLRQDQRRPGRSHGEAVVGAAGHHHQLHRAASQSDLRQGLNDSLNLTQNLT